MTVIVAARTGEDRVTIAADSEFSGGWEKGLVSTPKVWAEGPYAFGAAGGIRAIQVVKHFTEWPIWSGELDFESFAIQELVPAIRAAVKGHGVIEKYKDGQYLSMNLIVATEAEMVVIDEDFGVMGPSHGRMAVGSGFAEAYGALGDRGLWKRKHLVEAARRATVTAVGVGGPIYTVDTKRLEVRPA